MALWAQVAGRLRLIYNNYLIVRMPSETLAAAMSGRPRDGAGGSR
jgi:hypothetical protein